MPSDAGSFSFGDVILVPFPFTDQSAVKKRPAVVISSRRYNLTKPDLIMMAVTSRIRASPSFGEIGLAQWSAAGLLKPSAIKPVIATLEQARVIRPLGRLSTEDSESLRETLLAIVGN